MLAWDYAALSTNTTFYVWSRTNLLSPPAYHTNVAGTNTTVKLALVPGVYFFSMSASNVWGMSTFTQELELPEPPSSNHCIEITKP